MELTSIMPLFAYLLGLILGSFVNVCIYRIPLKRSIVHPPSSCPKCGRKIKFYDNIPILSYIILMGKCRHCREPIPFRYPVVEALTALFSLALFIRYGLSYQYVAFLLFTVGLLTISFIDLQHKIIPDVLSLPGIALGWTSSFVSVHISWLDSLIGLLIGGGLLWLIAVAYEWITGKEGMGGGDIKLLAMIGAWMGWRALPFVVLISSLSGSVIGGAALVLSGKGYRVKIPFGPFLSLGALVYLFFGAELVDWYSRLVW